VLLAASTRNCSQLGGSDKNGPPHEIDPFLLTRPSHEEVVGLGRNIVCCAQIEESSLGRFLKDPTSGLFHFFDL